MNALELSTVQMSEDRSFLRILDQTLLPGKTKFLELSKKEDIWEAINVLRVRGAPAIGVCAAYALALEASKSTATDFDGFKADFKEAKNYYATARPTAVNLFWAMERLEAFLETLGDKSVSEIKTALFDEADRIRKEDIAISRSIGKSGAALLKPGYGILTHCNAGTLATAKYGTATAPMYIAQENGMTDIRVYCDETRPLLQGARLTAYELHSAGIDTTLICDNMASSMMAQGLIDIVFVGADRIAENGDTANKIGTSGVAIMAHHYGIPFYVCAPSSTVDLKTKTGKDIVIEQRPPEEVTEMWYKERMAPQGVKVQNPAFDVTDHSLITGIITEHGIHTGPFGESFRKAGI